MDDIFPQESTTDSTKQIQEIKNQLQDLESDMVTGLKDMVSTNKHEIEEKVAKQSKWIKGTCTTE